MELESSIAIPTKVHKPAIEKAVSALLKYKSTKSTSEKPQLLPSDEFIYLVLTLTKISSQSRVNAFKIPLPNPLFTPQDSEFCLIVSDTNSKVAKTKIQDDALPISQVIKLTKLKKEYKAYEQKRKLCNSYDLFFAEKKIIPLLPNAIGKSFYKKKKLPVPVELSRGNWKEQIEKVCSSAMLYLSTGSCCVIKVGRISMEKDKIIENVAAAVEGVANVVPKKWANIRSFHLKFSESVALPIYQKVPEAGFKIGGGVEEKTMIEEGKKSEKVKAKKEDVVLKVKKKKGRIHEVRYMDEVTIREDLSESENEAEEVIKEDEEEKEKEKVVGKKRKKSDVEKKVKKGDKGLKKNKDSGVKKSRKSKVSV